MAWLRAGDVGRPHGLDGSFRVTHPTQALPDVGGTVQVGERPRRITRRSGTDSQPIVRLEGCDSRTDAQALAGQQLLVERDRAPELGPDEWWAVDLEGCAVLDRDQKVGVVTRVLELPSCEVLEVTRPGKQADLLVPLVTDAVRKVDVDRREIDIDLRFLGEV
jgi:16S rRNA processing protein RimM